MQSILVRCWNVTCPEEQWRHLSRQCVNVKLSGQWDLYSVTACPGPEQCACKACPGQVPMWAAGGPLGAQAVMWETYRDLASYHKSSRGDSCTCSVRGSRSSSWVQRGAEQLLEQEIWILVGKRVQHSWEFHLWGWKGERGKNTSRTMERFIS